jgi:flagellar basal body-associated protein FliL
LELDSEAGKEAQIPIADLDAITSETQQTVNLRRDPVSSEQTAGSQRVQDHYAMYYLTVVLNMKHADYKKYQPTITEKEALLNNTARDIISKYTLDEFHTQADAIQTEIRDAFRNLYQSDVIYDVQLSQLKFQ